MRPVHGSGLDPDRCRRAGTRAGFTIIEVVVVMLILAVATAITIPALLPPPADDDLTAATRKIDLLFGIARDSAARSGGYVTVMIDSATGGVWLLVDAEPDTAFAPAAGLFGAPRVAADGAADRQRANAGPGQGVNAGPGDHDARAGEPLDLPSSVRLELSKARAQFRFSATGAAFADSLVLRTASGPHLVTIDPWNGHAILH